MQKSNDLCYSITFSGVPSYCRTIILLGVYLRVLVRVVLLGAIAFIFLPNLVALIKKLTNLWRLIEFTSLVDIDVPTSSFVTRTIGVQDIVEQ